MALSTGQVNDAFQNALGRMPTGDELRQHTGRGDLEGTPGQNQLIQELGGTISTQAAQYTPETSPEQFAHELLKTQEEQIKRETEYLEQYTVDNPFVFDEELAKQSAKAQYEPYYAELLEDYLQDVGVKRETIQDEGKLLKALRTTPEGMAGEATRAYERAVSQAEEGFAGQGMFFSGIKKRVLGQAEVERGYGVQERARGVQQRARDVGREEKEAVEGGILTRRGEAQRQYYYPFVSSYKRQFPTGTQGVESYLPEGYMRY